LIDNLFAILTMTMSVVMMTLCNNSGTGPSSPNPPAVVYRDVAVAGGALLPLHTHIKVH